MLKGTISVDKIKKLPKTWKRWLEKAGLHVKNDKWKHREWTKFYFFGHGHHWRVNCYGAIQLGDSLAKFDRWALCDIVEHDGPFPRSEKEFVQIVKSLLQQKKVANSNCSRKECKK